MQDVEASTHFSSAVHRSERQQSIESAATSPSRRHPHSLTCCPTSPPPAHPTLSPTRGNDIGHVLNRSKRLLLEFKNLAELAGYHGFEVPTSMVDDTIDRWMVKLFPRHFPDTDLARDLERLPKDYPGSPDHMLLEIMFPPTYPLQPPFVRVVYPRLAFHSGHVSWGGSVCLEVLVNTGTPGGYNQTYTVDSILRVSSMALALPGGFRPEEQCD